MQAGGVGRRLPPPQILELSCHPDTPGGPVSGITAELRSAQAGMLQVTFQVRGRIAAVRLPASAARRDRLWEHTCFEVFVGRRSSPAYHEFNFAPSGDWALYAFHGYRAGALVDDPALDPKVSLRAQDAHLELEAQVRLDRLSTPPDVGRLALSAVIEDESGRLSYWALRHPAGKPDFHHPENFCVPFDEIRH